jgi:hypothetical protein
MTQQQKPDDKVTCVIYDEVMYFAEAAANHLKLSSIILCTSSVATAQSRVAIRQLKEEGCIPWQGICLIYIAYIENLYSPLICCLLSRK